MFNNIFSTNFNVNRKRPNLGRTPVKLKANTFLNQLMAEVSNIFQFEAILTVLKSGDHRDMMNMTLSSYRNMKFTTDITRKSKAGKRSPVKAKTRQDRYNRLRAGKSTSFYPGSKQ